jgi:hypothetical protein
MRVLVDRNFERHAVTHKTRTVPQPVKWGPLQFEYPVAQRSHDQPREDEPFLQEQLAYLVSLCRAAKEKRVEFCTSRELKMERLRQPISKEGCLGIDWFSGVKVTEVPCPVDRFALMSKVIGPDFDFFKELQEASLCVDAVTLWNKDGSSWVTADPETQKELQLQFFRWIIHPRFLHLRNTLGEAQLADAFHLWTAEEAHLDAFLTMDKKFLNNVHTRSAAVNSTVSVLTPKEVCEQLGIPPSDIEQLATEINPFA